MPAQRHIYTQHNSLVSAACCGVPAHLQALVEAAPLEVQLTQQAVGSSKSCQHLTLEQVVTRHGRDQHLLCCLSWGVSVCDRVQERRRKEAEVMLTLCKQC